MAGERAASLARRWTPTRPAGCTRSPSGILASHRGPEGPRHDRHPSAVRVGRASCRPHRPTGPLVRRRDAFDPGGDPCRGLRPPSERWASPTTARSAPTTGTTRRRICANGPASNPTTASRHGCATPRRVAATSPRRAGPARQHNGRAPGCSSRRHSSSRRHPSRWCRVGCSAGADRGCGRSRPEPPARVRTSS